MNCPISLIDSVEWDVELFFSLSKSSVFLSRDKTRRKFSTSEVKQAKCPKLEKYSSTASISSSLLFFPYKNFRLSISRFAKYGHLMRLSLESACNFCTEVDASEIRESNTSSVNCENLQSTDFCGRIGSLLAALHQLLSSSSKQPR